MKFFRILTLVIFASSPLAAQIVGEMDDESKLYAQSKQVNQFFRRFNGEEDEKGNRYYPKDRQYRSEKLRRKYLGILFDESNTGITNSLKTEFGKYILEKPESRVLQFHGGNWFSEVSATFLYNGKPETVMLYMQLEKHLQGTKWVIQKAYAQVFDPYFVRDTTRVGRFLHPMSHELEFMNMRKAFAYADSAAQFATRQFRPDHLTLFLYELKKGNMKFQSVSEVRFHFFQLEGWYFEVTQFNRPGYNTGWLISNLVKVNTPAEKEVLRRYLYNEK